jgi:hypothetical protein
MAPNAIPNTIEMANIKKILSIPVLISTLTEIYWPTIAIVVQETSTPPERSTRKIPTAKIAVPELLLSRSNRFSNVRKAGFMAVTKAEKRITISNT